jgi:hypothetical protein
MSNLFEARRAYAVLTMLTLLTVSLRAGPIEIPNGSFESPETPFAEPGLDSWEKTPKPFWYDEGGGGLWIQLTGVF